jgi:hypothetical protein
MFFRFMSKAMIKGAQNPLTEYLDALALGRIVANRFRK